MAAGIALTGIVALPSTASAASDVICTYKVNTTAGLNFRSSPSTSATIKSVLAYGKTFTAYRDKTASGSGYVWRQATSGSWYVGQYASQVGSICMTA